MTSVITLARRRPVQLARLARFLASQTREPLELVIAVMEGEEPIADPGSFPLKTSIVTIPGAELQRAAARNIATLKARGENLLFLDVNCLPAPTLVESYEEALKAEPRAVFMGEVFYLPELPSSLYPRCEAATELHNLAIAQKGTRPFPNEHWEKETDHDELSGLSFAITKRQFLGLGAFDEGYVGFGAEEKDFARRLEASQVPLFRLANAAAYYQYHEIAARPSLEFGSVIANAQRYFRQWGEWCMDCTLRQFAEHGLISWDEKSDSIKILRRPTDEEINRAKIGRNVMCS